MINRTLCALLAFSQIFLWSGCAAIIHGTTRSIVVISEPYDAVVSIDGVSGRTPDSLRVPARSSYVVRIEKEGYRTETRAVGSELYVGSFILDIFLGGIIGIIIDAATQAWLKPKPDTIEVELQPEI